MSRHFNAVDTLCQRRFKKKLDPELTLHLSRRIMFSDPHVFAAMIMSAGAMNSAGRSTKRGQFNSLDELKAHFAKKDAKKRKRKMTQASKKRNRVR